MLNVVLRTPVKPLPQIPWWLLLVVALTNALTKK